MNVRREFVAAAGRDKWLKEESLKDADELPDTEELATDAMAELEGAAEEPNAVPALLENGEKK